MCKTHLQVFYLFHYYVKFLQLQQLFTEKHFRVRFFKIDPTSVNQDQVFLSAAKGAVANSGSHSSLLFFFQEWLR